MPVRTISVIEEMTPAQQIELMEALWKSMSERQVNAEPPAWHADYLADREEALSNGKDSFLSLDGFEADLRSRSK